MKTKTFHDRIPEGIVSEADVARILNQHKHEGRTNWSFKDHKIKLRDEEHPVDWFYAVQIVMELLNPTPRPTTLPGADTFYEFLCRKAGEKKISVGHPIVLDTSYNRDYCKQYAVFADGKKIGVYKTFGPDPSCREYSREYHGILPGPSNKAEQMILYWSNKKFQYSEHESEHGRGQIVTTKWKRQDGWTDIPFP
jgi:hypothetical protein